MVSVDSRLAALASALERRKLEQAEPVDPLSASLLAFENQMEHLDAVGVAALAAETDERGKPILTIEQARRMVDSYRQGAADRRLSTFRSGVNV